VTCLTSSRR